MTDRDELLRQIGERGVERASADGFIYAGPQTAIPKCPACGVEGANPFHPFHANDCPLTRYLEATDE